ncbi:diversity-generating retroelement protein Avd [uncultured Thiocystis sp.]|jgi:hypothetical protein|uniref:diversity-generating retroelement protein Avd n=1 Tax=uncultured Thiocystis sp. TaxID=1202134 RepID=UPI0025E22AE8|nr:diversity-generating retroelement protein Avd [uncultured Thiocystis sp.]
MSMPTKKLSIIQKMYDFIQWYVPLLNKLPRQHKFALGERIVTLLYEILEQLIAAKYAREKLALLQGINVRLEVLRYQTRLLYDFRLIAVNRYEFAAQATHDIGVELGGWIRQQSGRGAGQ